VATSEPPGIEPDSVVHRVGGGNVENLRLSPIDQQEEPAGISLLLGGTPQEAAAQMRQAFPKSRKWQTGAQTVGSTTVGAIRRTGFDIILDRTVRFPNHVRLIHPLGADGFTDASLVMLSQVFVDTQGC
jgi:hypothetical protein